MKNEGEREGSRESKTKLSLGGEFGGEVTLVRGVVRSMPGGKVCMVWLINRKTIDCFEMAENRYNRMVIHRENKEFSVFLHKIKFGYTHTFPIDFRWDISFDLTRDPSLFRWLIIVLDEMFYNFR